MRILIIEDEEHKIADLKSAITQVFGKNAVIELCKSVRDGYLEAFGNEFDIVIIDMALPTFDQEGDDAGLAQATGGMEIIRLLANKKSTSRVLVVTQYPEVIVNNDVVKLADLQTFIKNRYSFEIEKSVPYSYGDKHWRIQFCEQLRELK